MFDANEMSKDRFEQILHWAELTAGYHRGELTGEKLSEWEELMNDNPDFRHWFNTLNQGGIAGDLLSKHNKFNAGVDDAIMQFNHRIAQNVSGHAEISETAEGTKSSDRRFFLMPSFLRYAAAIAIVLGVAGYFWINRNQTEVSPVSSQQELTDIAPGHDGAILTLADGSQVVLDSLRNGVVADQQGSQAVMKDGLLSYDANGKKSGTIVYNMVSTPNGRQFHLVLPDGSGVWLNAASSIRYPTAFTAKNREVEMEGEVYFEVVKNIHQPFIVKMKDTAQVEVLGTSFNINSYSNEASIRTTLLNGAVNIRSGAEHKILKPGQQGVVQTNKSITVINDADTDKAIAWKNGIFDFEDANLEEVMRQLSRWYDLEIVYEKGIPDVHLAGKMHRDVSLAGLLKGLKGANVNFRMEGRKLIVMP